MRVLLLGAALFCLFSFSRPAHAVINGQFLRGSEFHWVVRVTNSEGMCSGALLNSEWVITAGHCVGDHMSVEVIDYPKDFDFERFQDINELVAEYGVSSWADHSRRFLLTTREVERAYHKVGIDLALLKLKVPFTNVDNFAPVATVDEVKSLEHKHFVDLVVAGFGLNGKVGRSTEEAAFGMLKYYYYTAFDRDTFRLRIHFIPGNMYETHRGHRPALDETSRGGGAAIGAPGDSGGPLLANINGEWKIIGVNIMAGGSLRWIKFVVFGGTLEMPTRMRHLKIDKREICSLLIQTGGDLDIPGYECR